MLATLTSGDLSVLFVFVAFVAVCLALWRAVVRDVLGAILCAGVALVAIVIALN